jgi:hypothetical protein
MHWKKDGAAEKGALALVVGLWGYPVFPAVFLPFMAPDRLNSNLSLQLGHLGT